MASAATAEPVFAAGVDAATSGASMAAPWFRPVRYAVISASTSVAAVCAAFFNAVFSGHSSPTPPAARNGTAVGQSMTPDEAASRVGPMSIAPCPVVTSPIQSPKLKFTVRLLDKMHASDV